MVFKSNIIQFCCYCGRELKHPLVRTNEHLIPDSKGGSNIFYNKKPCCSDCNTWRSNKDLNIFKEEVELHIKNKIKKPRYTLLDYETMIENIAYWQHYIETSNGKLLRKK